MPTNKTRASITFDDQALYGVVEQYAKSKNISFSRAAQEMLALASEQLEDLYFSRVGDKRVAEAEKKNEWFSHDEAWS